MKPNLILIDGHYFLHRVLHLPEFVAMRNSKGVPTGGVFGVFVSIKRAMETFPTASRCVLAWDTGHSRRRKALLPEYKANRIPKTPEEIEERRKYTLLFNQQQGLLFQGLPKLGVRQMLLECHEGDDLIAWAAWHYSRHEHDGTKVLVVSEDKDLLQLVGYNKGMWMPSKDKLVTLDNFMEEVGVDTRLFLMYKALLGDASDNIPGIPGVGPGTIRPIIAKAHESTMFRSDCLRQDYTEILSEACEAVPKTKAGKMGTRVARVLDNFDVFKRNVKMMDLALDLPDKAEQECLKLMVEGGTVSFREDEAIQFLGGLEFTKLLEGFSWLSRAFGGLR